MARDEKFEKYITDRAALVDVFASAISAAVIAESHEAMYWQHIAARRYSDAWDMAHELGYDKEQDETFMEWMRDSGVGRVEILIVGLRKALVTSECYN
jgi:hypothetical protein